jgi:hypothetical protein
LGTVNRFFSEGVEGVKLFRRLVHVVSTLAPLLLIVAFASQPPAPRSPELTKASQQQPQRRSTEPKPEINVSGQPVTITISPPVPNQQTDQPNQGAGNQRQKALSEWWTIGPTVAIAFFTFGLFFFAVWQVMVYRQMRNHQIVVERAWVSISHHQPGVDISESTVTGAGEESFGGWHTAISRFVIANTGNTPARITDISMGHHIGALDAIPAPPTGPGTGEHALLLKGDSITDTREIQIRHTDREQLRLTLRLWFLGCVDYIDAFNVRRRRGYARYYDPRIDAELSPHDELHWNRRNNLPFVTQAGYNYDRKREKGEGNDWDEPDQ